MITHELTIGETAITPNSLDCGTKGSYGIYDMELTFSAEWDGLTKKISFYPPNRAAPVVVTMSSDDEVVPVPQEATANAGICKFIVSGVKSGVSLISLEASITVKETRIPATTPAGSPTPTEIAQIYTAIFGSERLPIPDVSGYWKMWNYTKKEYEVTAYPYAGSKGDIGAQGIQGTQGIQGVQGPKGDPGEKGGKGDTGAQGVKGATGSGFTILGYYDTLTLLQEAVPAPSAGNSYGIGAAAPYDIYVYDGVNSEWVNNGAIQGAKGDTGGQGIQGVQGPKGDPGEKGGKGDTGAQGTQGEQGTAGTNGARGSRISQGTSITGTTVSGKVFSGSGITDSLASDVYINTATFNMYKCLLGGNAATATWSYQGCITPTIANTLTETVAGKALDSTQGKALKDIIDAMLAVKTATITATWTGSSAPYTQNVAISGVTANDEPWIQPVYSTTNATAIAQQTAWNLIGKIVTGANKITVTCFGTKPTTAIPIQLKGY